MIRGLARKVQQVINSFPVRKNGVSDTISPAEIVEGVRKPDFSKRRVNFGQYVEIHGGTDNTATERSKRAIALYSTNAREGFAFMCLDTGRSRHSNNWTMKPISTEIIARVEELSKDSETIEDILNTNMDIEEEQNKNEMEYIKQKVIRSLERQQLQANEDNNRNVEGNIRQNVNDEASVHEQDQEDEHTDNFDRVITDDEVSNNSDTLDSENMDTVPACFWPNRFLINLTANKKNASISVTSPSY